MLSCCKCREEEEETRRAAAAAAQEAGEEDVVEDAGKLQLLAVVVQPLTGCSCTTHSYCSTARNGSGIKKL
jgi:hypothetical protein